MNPLIDRRLCSPWTMLLLPLVFFLFHCGEGGLEPDPGDYPEIYGFKDLDGNDINGADVGSDMYVVGAGFSQRARVFFGDKEALVDPQDTSANQIRTTVPAFAESQTVQVTVTVGIKRSAPKPFAVLAPRTFNVGGDPQSIISGDFNNDGHLDMAVANSNSEDVSVLLGRGDGTFDRAANYVTGIRGLSIVTGDLNGDGQLDLAVAGHYYSLPDGTGPSSIFVLLGSGDGTFVTAAEYSAGKEARSLAIGDLDGDGNLDLAVTNKGSPPFNIGGVLVFRGNGDGSFRGPMVNIAGINVVSVAIGDLDGNGYLDLVTVNESKDRSVSVLLGNGNGTFRWPVSYPAGDVSNSVAIADLDGDGDLDLAVTNSGLHLDNKDSVSVLLGNGNGTFQAPVNFDAGVLSRSVAAGDLNGDGRSDLAVSSPGSNDISILLGNGDGSFQAPTSYCTGSEPVDAIMADIDENGSLDLVVVNRWSCNISVLLGRGDGSFTHTPTIAAGDGPQSVAIDDLDGDGTLDLAVANRLSDDVFIFLGYGNGSFQAPVRYYIPWTPVSVAIADLDGDDNPDLVVPNEVGEVSVLLGHGDGTFQDPVNFFAGWSPKSVVIDDLDGDGALDLAVATQGDVAILLGNGDGSFQDHEYHRTSKIYLSIDIGDLDNDGDPDLAVTHREPGPDLSYATVSVLLNDGDGSFQEPVDYSVGNGHYYVAVGDLNGDGHLDLAAGGRIIDSEVLDPCPGVSIYLGNGDGTFQSPLNHCLRSGGVPESVALCDLDGNGNLDLVSVNFDRNDLSILLGNGDGTFKNSLSYVAGSWPSSVAFGDLNSDGALDLAVTDRSGDEGLVHLLFINL